MVTILHIAVCDDHKYDRDHLTMQIERYARAQDIVILTEEFVSGEALYERISTVKYDAVFLDINMKETSGMETAKRIRGVDEQVFIVFVTAYNSYVFDGYKIRALRYIMKDVLEAEFPDCMSDIVKYCSDRSRTIPIPFVGGEENILLDHIRYAESRKHVIVFHLIDEEEKEKRSYGKLDILEEKLEKHGFMRIHKSFLVNQRYITRVAGYQVFLEDGTRLPVPKLRYQEVKSRYILYKGMI